MSAHPPIADLIERSGDEDVREHLMDCAACRAQAQLLSGLLESPGDGLPQIETAREAMRQARLQASLSLSRSFAGPSQSVPELAVGQVVERYVVEARAGRGGMGTLYRVRHKQLGSVHALKVLHRTSGSVRQRLVLEGQAQSRLRHPNVVPVTDIVDVGGAPGLIMDFVDGPTLADYLGRKAPLPLEQVDILAQQIIRGVAAAHTAGIVHRDLKPANVLLAPTDEGYVAKVIDFGLAMRLHVEPDDPRLTCPETPIGTPAYMAPEQIHDATRADIRSDIFSLGAVLYELATGKQAFEGLDVVTIYDRIRSGTYTPADQALPRLPAYMVATIARALQVDPAERFDNCQDLLNAWRDSQHTAVAPLRSLRWTAVEIALGLSAVASAAIVLVLASTFWVEDTGLVDENESSNQFSERRLTALPDDIQVFSLALSPDGQTIAFADGRGLWVQEIEGGKEQMVLEGGPLHNTDFFPDGERILASGWRDGVEGTWSVSLDGSETTLHIPQSGKWVRLSPDGTQLAVVDERGLWIRPLDGGAATRLRPHAKGDSVSGITWSPSGSFIATANYSPTEAGAWIDITATDGSSSRRVFEEPRLVILGLTALAWTHDGTLLYALPAHDKEPLSELWAVEDAESDPDFGRARKIHQWTGFAVIRLRPSANTDRITYSRVTATADVHLLSLEQSNSTKNLTPEEWKAVPRGWMDAETPVIGSERGGGGLYTVPLDGSEGRLVVDEKIPRVVEFIDGALVWAKLDSDENHRITALIGLRQSSDGGEPTEFMRVPISPDQVMERMDLYGFRCRAERCLLATPVEDELQFNTVDPSTGERSAPVFAVDISSRAIAWDLSPDGQRLALIMADPPRLIIHDLLSRESETRPFPLDLPQNISWAADGEGLFAMGLLETDAEPYRLLAVDSVGEVRTLWSSMSTFFHTALPSPDGNNLLIGLYGFDDDVWLMEHLLEETD